MKSKSQLNKRLLVIDTETGGFDSKDFSILSLGVVLWENNNIVKSAEFFINEGKILAEPDALAVNQIDIETLKKIGLRPVEAVRKLEDFLSEFYDAAEKIEIAGHNVGFDIAFLRRLYGLANANFETRFSHRSLDTSSVMRFLMLRGALDVQRPGLDDGLKYFGINVPMKDRHSALGDALGTAQLLSSLLSMEL